jgi:hypothetical protein
MTDPRIAQRAMYAHWLRIRANVRALTASLAAAEHGLRCDARRGADADLAILAQQLAAERCAMDTFAAELDARIVAVKAQCDTIETGYLQTLGTAARLSRATVDRLD